MSIEMSILSYSRKLVMTTLETPEFSLLPRFQTEEEDKNFLETRGVLLWHTGVHT